MLIFIFMVASYSLANLYIFLKLSSMLDYGLLTDAITGLIILFMTLSPVMIPIYSNRGSEKAVRYFSYVGYMWLAFLVPFFPLTVLFDLYSYAVPYLASLLNREIASLLISNETTLYIPLFISLAVNGYGYYEAKALRTERITIRTSKLPHERGRIRIAQISDLHLGAIVRENMLDKVIQIIEREKPDMVISTGDLVDGDIRHISHLAEKLKKVDAGMGKFAITGNHELYGGIRHTTQFLKDSGFTVLRGEGVTIDDTINIAGIDFAGAEAHLQREEIHQRPEDEILSGLNGNLFTVLLKHRSDVEEKSLGLFDLQLSGHTHKGQIFPMNLATTFIFKHHSGFIKLKDGAAIYVSRGSGTAGPPIRFLSTPEVTIIDIVKEDSVSK